MNLYMHIARCTYIQKTRAKPISLHSMEWNDRKQQSIGQMRHRPRKRQKEGTQKRQYPIKRIDCIADLISCTVHVFVTLPIE